MFENWTSKDFRKAAFGVGLGLALGKTVAEYIEMAVDSAFANLVYKSAENGNKFCQEVVKKSESKRENTNKEEAKCKIGFRV